MWGRRHASGRRGRPSAPSVADQIFGAPGRGPPQGRSVDSDRIIDTATACPDERRAGLSGLAALKQGFTEQEPTSDVVIVLVEQLGQQRLRVDGSAGAEPLSSSVDRASPVGWPMTTTIRPRSWTTPRTRVSVPATGAGAFQATTLSTEAAGMAYRSPS